MEQKEYLNAIYDAIYLISCVVNDQTPDQDRIAKMNQAYLCQAAQKHMLTAIVGYALQSAGVINKDFQQAWAKSVRKNSAMEIEKELIFQEMEKEHIWYLPLKGTVIKDLYPSVGLRQMSDFDILFDKEYARKVRDIFIKLGFKCEDFGEGVHDVYYKKPVSNFEMHTALFSQAVPIKIYDYYCDISRLLIKDEGNKYGYHFSNNDLYIYLTAHEYRHYIDSGTGLRSLLDIYVFWQKYGSQMDTEYIASETKKMGIYDFEHQNRSLALHLFGNGTLAEEEQEMLEYFIFSGTYGTLQNSVENSVNKYSSKKDGRHSYVIKKIFMPLDLVKAYYPFYYRHKILLPVLFFYRIGKALTVDLRKTKKTLNILKKLK